MERYFDWGLALLSGAMLAVMIKINSALAGHTTAMTASWVAHAVGALAGLVVILARRALQGSARPTGAMSAVRPPFWSYLGGVPGAFAVTFSAMAVNSFLGLSAALAILLAGQLLFGLAADAFGLFGTLRRRLTLVDLVSVLLVAGGSLVLIYAGAR